MGGGPFNPHRACVDFFLKKEVKDASFVTLRLTDALVSNFRLCDDAFNDDEMLSFLSNHDLNNTFWSFRANTAVELSVGCRMKIRVDFLDCVFVC